METYDIYELIEALEVAAAAGFKKLQVCEQDGVIILSVYTPCIEKRILEKENE